MGISAALNGFFWRYIHGSCEGASRRWGKAIFILFLLFPGIGSGGSVWLEGMWIVAVLHWIFDPKTRRMTADEKKLVGVFAAYFLISAAFAFAHALALGSASGLSILVANLPFLLAAPIFPVLRKAARPGWTALMFAGFACGAILAAMIVTIAGQFSVELQKAGFSGNALILALGGLVSGLMCCHGMLFFSGRMRLLLAVGALASMYVMLISGTRGPLLSFCATAFVYAVVMGYRHFGLRHMLGLMAALLLVMVAAVTLAVNFNERLAHRYNLVVERLSSPADSSVGEDGIIVRLALYEAGWRAFLDRPVTGYGRQNTLAAARAQTEGLPERYFNYTHLHNGYLTDLVASGVLGLVSLLAVLVMPLIVFWNTRPVVFGAVLCVVVAYGFYGATNLLFYQDVATLLFTGVVVVCGAVQVEEVRL